MLDQRTLSQLGDVRRAAIREACDSGLTRRDDGWHPGYPTCDRRMPFNGHTIETLAGLGLLMVDGGCAVGTRRAHELLPVLDSHLLEAAE
jgi:hypothetical protein